MATRKPTPAYQSQRQDFNFEAGDEFLASLSQPGEAPAEPRGMARAVADTGLSLGRGAVQGVRMLTDLAGADNAVSGGLRSVEDYISSLKSAEAQADERTMAQILRDAEGKGLLDQVVAGFRAFGVAPVQTLAQAVGTSIPTVATALIPGAGPAAAAGRMGAALGIGAGQGAGAVKSSIYDEVLQAQLAAGKTPEEAQALAAQAQAYGGPNAGQIALGAGLGAWAGRSGIEAAADRLVRGTTRAAPGIARRVGIGAAAEGVPEALQGGQEKFATNTALANEGFDVDPMAGVVASGTMEALAGAAMGGALGIPRPPMRPGDQLRADKLPEVGPMSRAVNAAVEAAAKKADAGEPLPPEPMQDMAAPGAPTAEQPAEPAAPAAQPPAIDFERVLANMHALAAEEAQSMRQFGGAPAPAAPMGPVTVIGPEPVQRPAPDILNPKGEPFRNLRAAQKARAAQPDPGAFDVVPVDGGYVVRPTQGFITDGQADADAQPGALDGAAVPGDRGMAEQRSDPAADAGDAAAAVDRAAAGGDADGVRPGDDPAPADAVTQPAAEPVETTAAAPEGGNVSTPAVMEAPAAPPADADVPTLKKAWSDAVQRGDTVLATQINDRIVEAKGKNAPAPRTEPEAPAEQAPAPAGVAGATAAPAAVSATGSAEVEANGVNAPPKAGDYPNAATYYAALASYRAANPVTRPSNAVTPKADRRAEIKRELASLQDRYAKRMNRKDGAAPPAIKSDALNNIARSMDKLDAELKALDTPNPASVAGPTPTAVEADGVKPAQPQSGLPDEGAGASRPMVAPAPDLAGARAELRAAMGKVDAVNAEWESLYRDGLPYFTGDGPSRKLSASAPDAIKERFAAFKAAKKGAQRAYDEASAKVKAATPVAAPAPAAPPVEAPPPVPAAKPRQLNGSDAEKARALFTPPTAPETPTARRKRLQAEKGTAKRTLQEQVERPAAPDAVVATAGDPEAKGERKFYVTMVRGDRVARLAGPFDTKEEAEAMKPRAQDEANKADPRSAFDAFGVSGITSESHKPGKLNERLGIGAAAVAEREAAPAPAVEQEPAPQPAAEEAAAPAPAARQDGTAAGWWGVSLPTEREPMLLAAGWKKNSPGLKEMMSKRWGEMTPGQRNRIGQAIRAERGELAPEAEAAAPTPAQVAEPAEPAGMPAAERKRIDALRVAGQKLVDAGLAEQGRDRNANTARRARMAAGAESAARATEALGRTMVNIAEAQEAGGAQALIGIKSKAQVEALEAALRRGMAESEKALSYAETQRLKGRAPDAQDVKNSRLPQPSWNTGGSSTTRLRELVKGKKGVREVERWLAVPPTQQLLDALKAAGVTDKDIQYSMGWWNLEAIAQIGRFERMGIKSDSDLRQALTEYLEVRDGPKSEDPIKAAERKLIGQKVGFDFFPTPRSVADRMVAAAGIKAGDRVLEPSAGNGNIADAAKAAGARVDVVEISTQLQDLLKAKGYTLAGNDFMQFTPGEKYDAVVMNPPFSNRLDAEHIQRAYGLLKPGGRLVAIAGEGVFFGSDKKAQAFRDWLAERGAEVEKLPEGTFKDSQLLAQTGTNARLLTITAPGATAEQTRTDDAGNVAMLKRGTTATGSLDIDSARALAAQMAERGMVRLNVVQSVADMPARQRDKVLALDPAGQVRGAYFRQGDSIWMVADNIRGADEFVRIAFHEAFHRGLARTIPEAKAVLREMWRTNQNLRAATAAQMKAHGIGQDEAIEEALAVMAEAGTVRDLKGWGKLLETIRSWVAGFAKALGLEMTWTDDMVLDFVAALTGRGLQGGVHVNTGGDMAPAPDAAPAAADGPMLARTADALRDTIPEGVQQWMTDRTVSQRGFNRVWHRTVGTQLHKAKINKDFGRVYYAVQDFMKDVSRIATLAADKAPDMLPQIESLGDLARLAPTLASPAAYKQRKADIQAASAALFDGTLRYTRDEDGKAVKVEPDSAELGGIVWTDAELRERGLSDRAVKMYRQSRQAIDQSLENMLAADLYRQASVLAPEMLATTPGELDALLAGMRRAAASENPGQAYTLMRNAIKDRLAELETALDGQPNQHTPDLMARRQELRKLQTSIADKAQRIADLQDAGYAPLMRFGPYAVDAVNADGRRVFFGLYESQAAANKAARNFRSDGLKVTQSIMPQKDFEALQGVSPETALLFAEMLGVEKNEAMQAWLKNAVAEQSALKRHIRRKGIEGFDEDGGRVLAAFVTSNARAASRALHAARMADAVENVQQGDVKDEARALVEYVNNPKEEAQALRGLLFVQYIGGSIASAMVNLTQTLVQTLPYLSQYGGAIKAGARLSGAMKTALADKIADPALAKAVARAEKDGVIKPQEVFQLQAEASRSLGSNLYARSLLAAWGSMFQLAEQFNRRTAFIAAYETARQQGMADPFAFAENAVDETQSVFNKGNRPTWARGAVGSTLFTFKTFTIQYLEFLKRLATAGEPGSPERAQGRKAAALALLTLVMLSGMKGLPFADDADDLIDTVAQGLGYNWTTDAQRDKWLDALLGETFSDLVQHGFSGMPGVPFDVSQRLGMANLLPGTGLLKTSESNKQNQVLEVFGVAGSAVRDATQGQFLPVAIRNLMQGLDIYETGLYRDRRGRNVTEADMVDAVLKGIGLQPSNVARAQREIGRQIQQRSLYQAVKEELTDAMAQARFDGDDDALRNAQQALARWNDSNPEARIIILPQTIRQRLRQMRMSKAERTVANTPRPLRAQTAEALQ